LSVFHSQESPVRSKPSDKGVALGRRSAYDPAI
jgi:hypothetical protein